MTTITIHHHCTDFDSYRAARVKSLFNVESGADVHIEAALPLDARAWQIGVIVGPSGSGKTSIGKRLGKPYEPAWPRDCPIVDAISPGGSFDDVTAALASVGLGTVPSWLRPYHALSNGERFRANLARLICEAPAFAVLDEFSSVVDRQIAQIGAHLPRAGGVSPSDHKPYCYPAITTSSTGYSQTGSSTPRTAHSNGGGLGNAHASTWKYTLAVRPTGACLRRITI